MRVRQVTQHQTVTDAHFRGNRFDLIATYVTIQEFSCLFVTVPTTWAFEVIHYFSAFINCKLIYLHSSNCIPKVYDILCNNTNYVFKTKMYFGYLSFPLKNFKLRSTITQDFHINLESIYKNNLYIRHINSLNSHEKR